ncbi:hypothetical protein HYV12_02825 [Candidatus Dojkabacteria bacterium]|nr:hypothetical protein [Candidatus Dojkabacteria bacterium]
MKFVTKKLLTFGLTIVLFFSNWLIPSVVNSPIYNGKVLAATETFTTSGTWTAPTGVTTVTVEVWGGGGAGGGASGNPATGGGGAGGAYAIKVITVTPGNGYTYTVGAAKTATATSSQSVNTGNPSWFSTTGTVYAPGGQGGAPMASNSANGAAGTGSSTGAIGDTVYAGGSGSVGSYTSGSGYSGAGGGGAGSTGAGGNASTGTGGSGTSQNGGKGANGVGNSSTGATGSNYGGGGSGGKANNTTNRPGGTGAQGLVRITYNSPPTITVDTTESSDPITVGDNVTFSATATDAENNWYLAVCKTNSITAGSPPTCATSQTYCVSSSAVASGAQNTCVWTSDTEGSLNWYAFACDNASVNPLCSPVNTTNSPLQVNPSTIVSITLTTDGTIAYGTLDSNTAKTTLDLTDTQTVQNNGNVTVDLNIKTSAPSGWTLGTSTGTNQFVHQFSTNSGGAWTSLTTADSFQTLSTGLTESSTQSFDMKIISPNPSTSSTEKSITITIQAVQP